MAAKKTSRTQGAKPGGKPAVAPRLSRTPLKNEFLVASIVMAVAVCILYPELIFQGKIFFAGDNQAAASFSSVGQQALAEGVYPVWNPYLFSGMPSYESLSYTPYVYPVSFVLGLLIKYLFVPKYIWLFFHTWLLGIGTWLVLRDRRVHWAASIAAGILMMWMPNLVAVGANGHGSQACASGYLPFALLFWDRIWRGRGTVVNGCALALVLGLSMLRGHLQISYYTFALVALHVLFFGVARVIDGVRGNVPKTSMLPRKLAARLTGGGNTYSAGAAVVEWAYAGIVLAVVVFSSLLMSAVLHWPVHDYAQYSIRGASGGGLDYGYATSWSLHPLEALTFIFPFAFGFGKDLYYGFMPFTDYPNYLGVVVLTMAVAAFVLVRDRYVKFLGFVVVVATFTAFGRFFPVLYGPLFKLAPFFDKFRVPVMVLIVQQLAVVLLFGIGLDAVLRANAEKGKQAAIKGLAAAFLVFMIVVLSQGFWSGGFADSIAERIRGAQTVDQQVLVAKAAGSYLRDDLMRFCIMFALVWVFLFLYYNSRRLSGTVVAGLLLLVGMVDFYVVDSRILHPEAFRQYEAFRIIHDRSVAEKYAEPDDLIRFLKQDEGHYRVLPLSQLQRPTQGLFAENRFMNFGISSLGGYHAAKLSAYQEMIGALDVTIARGRFELANMLGARYIVAAGQMPENPDLKLVWSGTDYSGQPRFVYENSGAFPRAWFVDSYTVAEGVEALRLVASGGVDVASAAVIDRKPAIEPKSREGAVAVIEELGFNEIRIRASTPEASLLVLSEIYYPRWQVTVDGQNAELLRANHVLRAVALPPGEHEVIFSYDTAFLVKSATVSAVSMGAAVLILLGYFFNWVRSRKRGSADMHSNV